MQENHLENPASEWRVATVGVGRRSKTRKVGRVQTMVSTECLAENLGLKDFSMPAEDFPVSLHVRTPSLALSA